MFKVFIMLKNIVVFVMTLRYYFTTRQVFFGCLTFIMAAVFFLLVMECSYRFKTKKYDLGISQSKEMR